MVMFLFFSYDSANKQKLRKQQVETQAVTQEQLQLREKAKS